MSPRPERKRPEGRTPVQLAAHPEEIRISGIEPEAPSAPQLTAVPPLDAPAQSAAVVATPATPPVAPTAPQIDPAKKVSTTIQVREVLKRQAETAILTTGMYEGSYNSWAKFVNGAIAHELERLEQTFNGGESFPTNVGEFRNGRPLGD
jgi:hypothetical protein